MSPRALDLLEKVFAAEIEGALAHGAGIHQTRAVKLAEQLVADGLIAHAEVVLGGRFPVKVRGYRLTEFGRLTYCMSDRCAEPDAA